GLTSAAGSVPAESTSTRSPARCLRKPAAIWLRPALWTHTKRTVVRPTQALKGVNASLIRAVPQWDAGPGGRTISVSLGGLRSQGYSRRRVMAEARTAIVNRPA